MESALHSFIVTPTLLKVEQTVNMPEGETVTGPNFYPHPDGHRDTGARADAD